MKLIFQCAGSIHQNRGQQIQLYRVVKFKIHFVYSGKVWTPKEEEKITINEDEDVDTEWDDILAKATEEELVDLAGKCSKKENVSDEKRGKVSFFS